MASTTVTPLRTDSVDVDVDDEPVRLHVPRRERMAACLAAFADTAAGTEIHVERIGSGARGACGSFVVDDDGACAFEDLTSRYGAGEYRLVAVLDGGMAWELDTPVLLVNTPEPPAPAATASSSENLILAMMQQNTQILTQLIGAMGQRGSAVAAAETEISKAQLSYTERMQQQLLETIQHGRTSTAATAAPAVDPFGQLEKMFGLLDRMRDSGLIADPADAAGVDDNVIADVTKQVAPVVSGAVREWFTLRREQLALDAAKAGIPVALQPTQ